MDKENMVRICVYTMEHYSVIKQEILSSVTTWVKLEDVIISEVSQTEDLYVKSKHTHK